MFLLLVSFIAGVLTVLAPCVLPLLPIIVGGSLAAGERKRAVVISVSLGASVILFTLLLKASTVFIAIPQSAWEIFSGVILVIFGLILIFPNLWDSLGVVNLLNRSSNKLLAAGYQKNSLWGDVIMGASLGPVFSSCSPTYFVILATVLPASFAMGVLDLLAYSIGLSGFLLLIALLGQGLVDRLGVTINPSGWFRRGIGILFIIVGLAVGTGTEASLEAWLLSNGFDVTMIEQHLLGASNADTSADATSTAGFLTPEEKANIYPKAPELASPDGYINTGGKPITIGQFQGKDVVLVDFWTYSCINCIRTIPYVESWYQKYKNQGLVVIGVHTPEFAFEHVYQNVLDATKRLGITYPVVQDNEYRTWNAFGNQFWPREYLIDIDGYIVHDHSGEGDYDGTEAAIQRALAERAQRLSLNASSTGMTTPTSTIPIDFSGVRSPETYFGAERNEYLGNGRQGKTGTQTFTSPNSLNQNALYLGGAWNIEDQFAESTGNDTIEYEYNAKNVYFVTGTHDAPVQIEVTLDGKPLTSANAGSDIRLKGGKSYVEVSDQRLYSIVQGQDYGVHTLKILVPKTGLEAYTLTFG